MRVILIVAYHGGYFKGLQQQKQTKQTVIGTLQYAFTLLNIHTHLVASGRTDSDVHACKQVIHADVPTFWQDTKRLKQHLQQKLPDAIYIKNIVRVHEAFHARYDAYKRQYRYIIQTKERSPFTHALYYTHHKPLHAHHLNAALQCFIGEHDFALFHKTGSNNTSTIRTIYSAFAYQHKEFIIISVSANGFLRAQMRLLIATALAHSDGALSLEQIHEQLTLHKRYIKKPAPAHGLYLCNIHYTY